MKRLSILLVLSLFVILVGGGAGCASDPNVEGAKLDLRNKDYDRALQNVETALSKNPNNPDAHDLKGRILQEQAASATDVQQHSQMVNEMMQSYAKAVELNPELKADIDQRLRLAYWNEFQRGIQAFNRGKENKEEYNSAITYFSNASMIQPDSTDAYTNAAFSMINAGRSAEAITPFEKAIQMGDNKPDTYVLLSDLYMANDRAGDAVTLLEGARQKNPASNQQIIDQLLNAYIKAGQVDRAMGTFSEAVNSDPNNKLYRYNYGTLLLQSDQYDQAIEQFQQAVRLDAEYGLAHYNLGASYVNKAVGVNEQINKIDDDLRENRTKYTAAQISEREKQLETLAQQRRDLFGQAITPLENAQRLGQAAGEDVKQICMALFTAYVQTGQQDKAQTVSGCAGF